MLRPTRARGVLGSEKMLLILRDSQRELVKLRWPPKISSAHEEPFDLPRGDATQGKLRQRILGKETDPLGLRARHKRVA